MQDWVKMFFFRQIKLIWKTGQVKWKNRKIFFFSENFSEYQNCWGLSQNSSSFLSLGCPALLAADPSCQLLRGSAAARAGPWLALTRLHQTEEAFCITFTKVLLAEKGCICINLLLVWVLHCSQPGQEAFYSNTSKNMYQSQAPIIWALAVMMHLLLWPDL